MRTSLVVLIAVSIIGVSIITIGFLTNQEVNEQVKDLTPYQKLDIYREELEKINYNNQKLLSDLEKQIRESDDANLEQLKKEIGVLKKIIDDNKKELQQVIQKLSEMERN
ncbi:MAG: hypothetical protein R3237_03780 [Nitrosopumilaceae archaeon]|nr:hypothetical protein [Nitrosopumilaceae archaeon]